MINTDAVRRHIEYIKNDKYDSEFCVALLLYDLAGLYGNDITEEDINKAYEISKKYSSIYKDEIRDEINYELSKEQEEEKDIDEYEK